jgi:arginyl-tRNA synthetase
VLSADLRHAVAAAAREAGYPGQWRDVGLRDGGAPGRYLSVLPLRLTFRPPETPAARPCRATGPPEAPATRPPEAGGPPDAAPEAAAAMAAILRAVAWIDDAQAAGNGYLTITVTPEALAEVAVRVVEAGPACARSDALAGTCVPAPPGTPLTEAPSWPEARKLVIAQVTARLATAAGATVADDHDAERAQPLPGADRAQSPVIPPSSTSPFPGAERVQPLPGTERAQPRAGLPPASTPVTPAPTPPAPVASPPVAPAPPVALTPVTPAPTPLAAGVAFAGLDAIAYSLARIPPERPVAPDPAAWARHDLANPAYAVRYAHSCAASTLRWAAALDLVTGKAAAVQPGSLAHPRERALLTALSWLPEQVARAARRGRPHEFTVFLEELAETYQACRVACPAWPERGHDGARRDGLPGDARTVRARLWLTRAAATGLAAGLTLLGVGAPSRL